ncbi:MAG: DUF2478 domain-containing protein [Pseudomonadota bacterium]
MRIAATTAPGKGATDLLLEELAERLTRRGLRTVGVVQINSGARDGWRCDMDVRVLPKGATLRISQSLGAGSRGCRLDPCALETAVALVETELTRGAACLIVNKFGKHEAQGRGFCGVIGEALARDVPVLVGLNALNAAAFERFAAGLSVRLAPDLHTLERWVVDGAQAEPVREASI